jgi:hypothetical protein
MYNPFEKEFLEQVQKIRDLRNRGMHDEADLEQNTLESMNQSYGKEDIMELNSVEFNNELEVIYE